MHVVTPPGADRRDLITTQALVRDGAPLVQVRTKGVDDRGRLELAAAVVRAARSAGATCLVNDRVDIALAAGADGVHVGKDDLPAASARRLLGAGAVVGATCRNAEDARRAEGEGASYVGVGPVYGTSTKTGLPDPIGPRGIEAVAAAVDIPVIGISGVTAANAGAVLDAGAWGVAVVAAVYRADDSLAALHELMEITGCG
ncbi:MAG: thiamine phosphate synthase [Acidimicrobiales bacterium]|nr:thiamine phosphate synthase [Acidimicrobiales bacterium]